MKIKYLAVNAIFTTGLLMMAGAYSEEANFKALDADGDGYISMSEADQDPMLKESWNAIDSNQDGMVEKAEFSAFEEKAEKPAE